MAVEERLYTVEEFEQIADSSEYRDRLLELINGEIVEKVPTEKHGMVTGNVYGPIWNYVQQHRSGRVVMEVRHRMPEDKRNARIPDVSYTAGNKPLVTKGSVLQMPDLAVEVKSPDDSLKIMREKARYYLANGVRLVWLVIPEKRLVEVYTPMHEEVLSENDTLSGEDVLPGFTLPVKNVFQDTAVE
ncbi:MAG: Uma2 family endonuclease [Burkholderiales bacterium]|nr:Uma2 family endonuclease [Anaerolineae bacterium]